MYYTAVYPSPVGMITLACDGTGSHLVGLWIEGQKYHGESVPEAMLPNGGMADIGDCSKMAGSILCRKKAGYSRIVVNAYRQ